MSTQAGRRVLLCLPFLLVPAWAEAQSITNYPYPYVTSGADGSLSVYSLDGAVQAQFGYIPAAVSPVEIPDLLAGISGAGATLLCDSATSTNVGCNVVAQGTGAITFGNGSGRWWQFIDGGKAPTGYVTLTPATSTGTLQTNTIRLAAVALQAVTKVNFNFETVLGGFSAGTTSSAVAQGASAFGIGTIAQGVASSVTGYDGYDFAGSGLRCHSSYPIIVPSNGTNEVCEQTLQRAIANGSATRLTVDGGSGATQTQSVPIQNNGHGTWKADVECSVTVAGGTSTAGDTAAWLAQGSFTRVGGTPSLPYSTGTGTSLVVAGTLSTATLAISADVTNNNFNLTVTPPAGNTGTIACAAIVRWMQRIS